MSVVELFGFVAVSVYGLALASLAVYALHLLHLLRLFVRHRPEADRVEAAERARPLPPADALPHVLVQLPVFNERDVVARVVAAAGRMRWPRDLYTVQLLDDSTDDSAALGAAAIATLRAQGIDAHHVRRADRTGFKAGALAHGMALCPQAEFIAIFDADFVPHADFLERAIRPFADDPGLALVQGRWEHLNTDENILTAAQALGIDGHFAVEQGARAWSGLALNFNGTCGMWRRTAIEDAGGWEHDTLTEDLDLSYRAQLRGWRCTYRLGLAVPGELPADVHAWRAQQFRWAKGSQQTTRKLAARIWTSGWPLERRVAALLHTSHYAVHPLILISLCSAPVAVALVPSLPAWAWALGPLLFLLGTFAPIAVYAVAQRALGRSWGSFLRRVPILAALGTGIAINNARAVAEAWRGRVSAFVRTPKRGDGPGSYRARAQGGLPELVAGTWAAIGIGSGLATGRAWLTPLLLIYASGFLYVGWRCWRSTPRPAAATGAPCGPEPRRRDRWRVVACGAVALLAYAALGSHPETWLENPPWHVAWGLLAGVAYLVAVPAVRRSSPALTLTVLGFALAFRIAVAGIAPSDDVARYVVEGTLLSRGGDPYATAPADPATREVLAGHVDPAVQQRVNHPSWTAIYPPVALGIQAAIARASPSVGAQRLGASVAELLALLLVLSILRRRGLPPALILLAAWNPVTVIWIAGEGHNDSYAMLFLVAAAWALDRRREIGGLVGISLAALCKPFAVVALAPPLLRGAAWRWSLPPALALAAYAPFLDGDFGVLRSFGRFGTELHHGGALEPVFRSAFMAFGLAPVSVRSATVAALAAVLLLGAVSILRRRDATGDPLVTIAMLLALLLLCLPTLHPWYLTVLVPLLPFLPLRALLWWTASAPLHWLHGLAMDGGARWAELGWVTALVQLPVLAMLSWTVLNGLRRSPPRAAIGVG